VRGAADRKKERALYSFRREKRRVEFQKGERPPLLSAPRPAPQEEEREISASRRRGERARSSLEKKKKMVSANKPIAAVLFLVSLISISSSSPSWTTSSPAAGGGEGAAFWSVEARKVPTIGEKKPTKKELRENYLVNHPRPFTWAETKAPDTTAFDEHVQKVAKENFEKKMNPDPVVVEDDTEWDDNIVDPDYEDEEDELGADEKPPSLLDAFKNKKIPKVETMSKEESPFVEILILAPSAFLLIGLMYMWRCKYAWKENFQESRALSELNKVRESKEYALFSTYISSGNFDVGMLYWSLGGVTLLLQMQYNAVYALVPPMTSLAVGVFYSMIFQRSLTGIPGVTGPPLAQRLLILATAIILLMNLIYCEVNKSFVAKPEYWYVTVGMIVVPQLLAFYHRLGGWIQHNREYRYKMVE